MLSCTPPGTCTENAGSPDAMLDKLDGLLQHCSQLVKHTLAQCLQRSRTMPAADKCCAYLLWVQRKAGGSGGCQHFGARRLWGVRHSLLVLPAGTCGWCDACGRLSLPGLRLHGAVRSGRRLCMQVPCWLVLVCSALTLALLACCRCSCRRSLVGGVHRTLHLEPGLLGARSRELLLLSCQLLLLQLEPGLLWCIGLKLGPVLGCQLPGRLLPVLQSLLMLLLWLVVLQGWLGLVVEPSCRLLALRRLVCSLLLALLWLILGWPSWLPALLRLVSCLLVAELWLVLGCPRWLLALLSLVLCLLIAELWLVMGRPGWLLVLVRHLQAVVWGLLLRPNWLLRLVRCLQAVVWGRLLMPGWLRPLCRLVSGLQAVVWGLLLRPACLGPCRLVWTKRGLLSMLLKVRGPVTLKVIRLLHSMQTVSKGAKGGKRECRSVHALHWLDAQHGRPADADGCQQAFFLKQWTAVSRRCSAPAALHLRLATHLHLPQPRAAAEAQAPTQALHQRLLAAAAAHQLVQHCSILLLHTPSWSAVQLLLRFCFSALDAYMDNQSSKSA